MVRMNRTAAGVLVVSLALSWGCATSVHDSYLPARCETAEECGPGVACSAGLCAQVYWIDDTDKGDDIWTPGCHWRFSDAACKQNRAFHSGDFCEDEKKSDILEEYTNQVCHTAADRKRYDCDRECKRKHGVPGDCVTAKDACGKGNPSAKCVCLKIDV